MADTGVDQTDPTAGPRDGYAFTCGYGCDVLWNDEDLVPLAKRAVGHYHENHGDDLSRRLERFDRREIGGHHVHGDTYQIKRRDYYLTVYDVLDSVGAIDDWLAAADSDRVCPECHCVIPATEKDHRIEDNPNDVLDDSWTCSECVDEQEVDRREQENQQITEWTA